MVTVLNNPSTPTTERSTTVERTDDSAGWAVAVIILLALVALGGFLWMRYNNAPAAAPASNGGDNINVTLPGTSGGSNTGGGTTGGGATGGAGGGTGGGAVTPAQ